MRKLIQRLFFFLIVFLISSISSFAQNSIQNILNRQVSIEAGNTTLLYLLSTLETKYRVPILFEVADSGMNKNGYNIDLNEYGLTYKSGKVKHLLEYIVKQRPNYKWEIKDDVINFVPVTKRNPVLENFLDIQVKSFIQKGNYSKFAIRDKVLDLPEITQFFAEYHIEKYERDYPLRRSIYSNDEVDLSSSNATVREVLNKIVKYGEYTVCYLELDTRQTDGKTVKTLHLDF